MYQICYVYVARVCPKGSGVPVFSETLLVSEIWTEGAAEGLWAKRDPPGGVQFSAGDWTKAERRLVGMGRAIFSSLCLARAACTASVWISIRRTQRTMKRENEQYRKANGEKNSYTMPHDRMQMRHPAMSPNSDCSY